MGTNSTEPETPVAEVAGPAAAGAQTESAVSGKHAGGLGKKATEAEMTAAVAKGEAEQRAVWKANGPWFAPTALVITALSIAVPGVTVVANIDDPVLWFKGFALSATVVGAVAGGIRLAAHNGDKNLDGFGKMLGFSAALLSAFAAGSLFFIDLTQLNP